MNIFHRHKFDPDKWKLISAIPVGKTLVSHGVKLTGSTMDLGIERVFSNTCIECGDLVFRRVTEVDNAL